MSAPIDREQVLHVAKLARLTLREQEVETLFDAMGRVLACYSIDESRLSLAD